MGFNLGFKGLNPTIALCSEKRLYTFQYCLLVCVWVFLLVAFLEVSELKSWTHFSFSAYPK